ncbi:MAG: glycosyl transferase [Hirschia sp.]|nr:glycosyl transferase [Hirschia sp.]MBF18416.1 glycosyl transferase [Hirschia sp.]
MNSLIKRFSAAPVMWATLLIGALVLFRLVALILAAPGLGPDEAQYWRWSHELDWGYFSKPPLIAWMINATTSVFGHDEWAVRLYAPLTHGIAAFFLFLLGRRAYGLSVGGWAAATYILMPGVWLSSGIVSTDGLLLPCISLALYSLWRQREGASWTFAICLGLAIGLGFLAKYAAIYLVLGIAIVFIIDRPTRRGLLNIRSLATLVIAAALITPNIMWNAANDFATVSHTAENTKWGDAALNFQHFPEFLLDQMAVFGPFSFAILIGGLALILPSTDPESAGKDRWLLSFILPALIAISIQAVISRAHANWAASAYAAGSVLAASWAIRANWGGLLKFGLVLQFIVGLIFVSMSISPALADKAGFANAYKRARGWPQTVEALRARAEAIGASEIVFDERENWHGLDYYGERADPQLAERISLWRRHDAPHSFGESAAPVSDDPTATLLVASVRSDFRARERADFKTFEGLGELVIPLGGGRERRFCLYRATGYAPLPRTAEYEAAFRDEREDCSTGPENEPSTDQ